MEIATGIGSFVMENEIGFGTACGMIVAEWHIDCSYRWS